MTWECRWIHSFLSDRQQRVKIDHAYSGWLKLKRGMPQGSWLGPYLFLVLINNLRTSVPMHKFVDNITLSEVIGKHDASIMQSAIDELGAWSENNNMNVNIKKTKEIVLGPAAKLPQRTLVLNNKPIDRVHSFKLLGVCCYKRLTLTWDDHVAAICSKTSKRL